MRPRGPVRSALVSVIAATTLVAIKLVTGLITGSLALIAEAIHSGTDLIAALLTFLALRVAIRPADPGHPFGHGKAEHLAALAEGTFLLGASALIAYRSLARLTEAHPAPVDAAWYAFAVLGVVIVIDAVRAVGAWRASREYASPALASNAIHFASDLVGSAAVLVGLGFVRAGQPAGDSVAALLVAGLVIVAAARLMRKNVQVLMDQAPGGADAVAREAIAGIQPPVRLRRLRIRQSAGRHFADVVVGVRSDAGVGQGHAVADAVERALHAALPGSDVVVHVEPRGSGSLRERVSAAALTVRGVREIHNLTMLEVDGRTELSLHLKLPPEMSLDQAHIIASETERAITEAVSEVASVHTHIEPLKEPAVGRAAASPSAELLEHSVVELVEELTGTSPVSVRLRETDGGAIVFLTLAVGPERSLVQAHERATLIEERIRQRQPSIVDVVIHTEPS